MKFKNCCSILSKMYFYRLEIAICPIPPYKAWAYKPTSEISIEGFPKLIFLSFPKVYILFDTMKYIGKDITVRNILGPSISMIKLVKNKIKVVIVGKNVQNKTDKTE